MYYNNQSISIEQQYITKCNYSKLEQQAKIAVVNYKKN